MGLALGRAGADRRPADEVRGILRDDGVEHLGTGGKAESVHRDEELARHLEAAPDIARAVEAGVDDKTAPPDGRAGLFEIHAHDDAHPVLVLHAELGEALRVVERGLGVMNRAGPDDDEEPIVLAPENPLDFLASLQHGLRGLLGRRIAFRHRLGREQGLSLKDAHIT